jgi:hypothetical protein
MAGLGDDCFAHGVIPGSHSFSAYLGLFTLCFLVPNMFLIRFLACGP